MEWQQAHSLTRQKRLKSPDFGFEVKIGKVYLFGSHFQRNKFVYFPQVFLVKLAFYGIIIVTCSQWIIRKGIGFRKGVLNETKVC